MDDMKNREKRAWKARYFLCPKCKQMVCAEYQMWSDDIVPMFSEQNGLHRHLDRQLQGMEQLTVEIVYSK